MGALLVAVNSLTGAVKENSRKVDNLTAEMSEIKAAFAVHQTQAGAESSRRETAHNVLEIRVMDLERRQDADDDLRSTSLKDELTELKDRLKTDAEHNDAAAAKDAVYFRSRRNYWIGLVATFLLGLAATWFASTVRDDPPEEPKKQLVEPAKPKAVVPPHPH